MTRLLLAVSVCISLLHAVEYETTFENSNFTLTTPVSGKQEQVLFNYNRFRLSEHITEGNWFVTAIGDIENYLGQKYIRSDWYQAASLIRSDTPFPTQSRTFNYGEGEAYAQLYRLYAGYADAKNRFSVGVQKVSMGVGRIWNPTDLFNPRNPLALEPNEVYGVFSFSYTYAPSRLSELTAVAAQKADESFKYAGRFKGYLEVADAAVDAIWDEDVRMLGYELEGELLETGIELRSEGGWFEDKLLEKSFFQGLIGADYAFENSLTLVGEWLHSTRTFKQELSLALPSGAEANLVSSKDYLGISTGFEFNALLYGSLSGILNAADGSSYLSPVLSYSLADDMSLLVGAMLYNGKNGSEFGDYGQIYYINYKVTF